MKLLGLPSFRLRFAFAVTPYTFIRGTERARVDIISVAIYDIIVNYISAIKSEVRCGVASDENSRKRVSEIPPFGLRLQPDLKRQLEERAKAGARSLNAEIVARLEFTLETEVLVQETGFDVGHGFGSSEWIAAIRKLWTAKPAKQKSLEQRVAELEDRIAVIERRG